MSIIERIQHLQQEQAVQADRERIVRETQRRSVNQAVEERQRQKTEQNRRIMESSGIMSSLERIDRELLNIEGLEHGFWYSQDHGHTTLAWGKGFTPSIYNDGELHLENGPYDINTITVTTDPDKVTLTIKGKNSHQFKYIQGKGWGDLGKIEEAMAEAFVNPQYYYDSGYVDSST